jgi:hypothetical protein
MFLLNRSTDLAIYQKYMKLIWRTLFRFHETYLPQDYGKSPKGI